MSWMTNGQRWPKTYPSELWISPQALGACWVAWVMIWWPSKGLPGSSASSESSFGHLGLRKCRLIPLAVRMHVPKPSKTLKKTQFTLDWNRISFFALRMAIDFLTGSRFVVSICTGSWANLEVSRENLPIRTVGWDDSDRPRSLFDGTNITNFAEDLFTFCSWQHSWCGESKSLRRLPLRHSDSTDVAFC